MSEYLRIYKEKDETYFSYNYKTFSLNDINYFIEEGIIKSNNFRVTSKIQKGDEIVYFKNIFILKRNDKIYLYFKPLSLFINKKCIGLENFKNLKYKRRKTNYMIKDEYLYYNNWDTFFNRLKLTNYKIKSIKILFNDFLYIEDKENIPYISDGYFIIPLLIDKNKITNINSYNSTFIICSKQKDKTVSQINNKIFVLKNNNLYLENECICKGIKMEKYFLILFNDTLFKENSPTYTINLFTSTSEINRKIDYKYFKNNFLIANILDKYYIFSKKDKKITKINNSFYNYLENQQDLSCLKIYDEYKSNYNDYDLSRYHKKFVKTILYGWTIENNIFNRYFRSDKIWNILNEQKELDKYSLKDFNNEIYNIIINCIYNLLNKYGIKMSKEQIIIYYEDINFIDFVINIKNVKQCCDNNNKYIFSTLVNEINNFVNNTEDKNIYKEKIDIINKTDFECFGLNIDKFNSFNEGKKFIAMPKDIFSCKNSLQETIIQQIENILGSKRKKKEGVLQCKKLKYMNYIYFKMMHKYFLNNHIDEIFNQDKNNILKIINHLGIKLFKILKSYQVNINYTKKEIYLNNIYFIDNSYSKILSLTNNIIDFIVEAICIIDKSNINNEIKIIFTDMLRWSVTHLQKEIEESKILNKKEQSNCNIQSKNLKISIWDRHDIFKCLAEGSRTHCCISLDSYNIYELVNYIFNKNIIIIEIIDDKKNKVIGQGFCYLAHTKDKINYNYKI